jgi:nitrate reductase gamma subunit
MPVSICLNLLSCVLFTLWVHVVGVNLGNIQRGLKMIDNLNSCVLFTLWVHVVGVHLGNIQSGPKMIGTLNKH